MPGVFPAEETQELRAGIDEFYERCPYGNDDVTNLPLTQSREDCIDLFLHMPMNNPIFESIIEKPILHNTVERMLGKGYFLDCFNMRRVHPGAPRMPFHRDSHGGFIYAILTDDVGIDEGATAIVKRTHLGAPAPMYCMDDTSAPHPDEIQATGKAGDVYFLLLGCWHGRSENKSNRYTGIMLPDFCNRSMELVPPMRHFATKEWMDSIGDTLRNALRPFDKTAANIPANWLDRQACKNIQTEYFFQNILYFLRIFRGRHDSVGVDGLPPNTTAAALGQMVTLGQCFRGLKPKQFVRRYLISMTLNRLGIGSYVRRLLGRE